MRILLTIFTFLLTQTIYAQVINISEMQPPAEFENIHVEKLATDSLSTSFVIWVKQEVKSHYHAFHTETLYVLEGTGVFNLGEKVVNLAPGDFIEIPKGTFHSVFITSPTPMKVLSVQAPEFNGKDRIFAGQLKRPGSE